MENMEQSYKGSKQDPQLNIFPLIEHAWKIFLDTACKHK